MQQHRPRGVARKPAVTALDALLPLFAIFLCSPSSVGPDALCALSVSRFRNVVRDVPLMICVGFGNLLHISTGCMTQMHGVRSFLHSAIGYQLSFQKGLNILSLSQPLSHLQIHWQFWKTPERAYRLDHGDKALRDVWAPIKWPKPLPCIQSPRLKQAFLSKMAESDLFDKDSFQ